MTWHARATWITCAVRMHTIISANVLTLRMNTGQGQTWRPTYTSPVQCTIKPVGHCVSYIVHVRILINYKLNTMQGQDIAFFVLIPQMYMYLSDKGFYCLCCQQLSVERIDDLPTTGQLSHSFVSCTQFVTYCNIVTDFNIFSLKLWSGLFLLIHNNHV